MPRFNHKNILFFEKQRNITINGVRVKEKNEDQDKGTGSIQSSTISPTHATMVDK